MRIFIIIAAIVALIPLAGNAAPSCYSPKEVKAEQLLRLHSELMVVAVTCRSSSKGENLGTVYGNFTKKNIADLKNAESVMIEHYRADGKVSGKKGIERLDRLRTLLANEFGREVVSLSPEKFCQTKRDRPVTLEKAPVDKLAEEAVKIGTPPTEPMCKDQIRIAQR